jgi:AraC family transcriptional regulator
MFKIATGHSPHRYMVIQRIERAKTLLATSNMTIGQVANAVGFRTQAHFTGVFRQIAGTTPGNFRRMQGAPTPMVAAFVTRAESTAR